ncbi:hypothetical protein PSN_4931 [Pseudomonas sp. NGC7]
MAAPGVVVAGDILVSGLSGGGEGVVKIAFRRRRLSETVARAYAVNCKTAKPEHAR